ncbi:MAG: TIGR02206 family membrane protein [Phycisphaerales bacterium]
MILPLAAMPDCATEFRPFTACHWIALACCALVMAGVSIAGVRFRGTSRAVPFRTGLGWAILLYKVAETIYECLPHRFDIAHSLPLQFCDLAAFAAGGALLTQPRTFRILLYFWGAGLTSLAVLMPTLHAGYLHADFWIFWTSHAMVLAAVLYDIVVNRFRPTRADFLVASAWGFAYLAVVTIVNLAFDVNYGFVGNPQSGNPVAIERIGPWPQRVWKLTASVALVFLALWQVWSFAALFRRAPAARID